jgi:cell division protein FtsW (lipid II flippase)
MSKKFFRSAGTVLVEASLSLVLLMLPIAAAAQLDPITGGECLGLPCGNSVSEITDRIDALVNAVIYLISIVAILFLVYAGYKYITSTGSEEAAAQAKRQIIYAGLGVALAFIAFLLRDTLFTIADVQPGDATATLRLVIDRFVRVASILIGITASVYLVYAGYKYINARGDYEGADTARRQIVYAVIGMVVAGGAEVISGAFIRPGTSDLIGEEVGGQAIATLIQGPINIVLAFASIAATAYIIMAGVMYFSAAGDEQQTERAKRHIIYALAGIAVILLSAATVNFIIAAVSL